MTSRRIVLRAVAALVLIGCSAMLALLARDVWHWQRAIADADARTAVQALGGNPYAARTALPSGFVEGLLGISKDVTFRNAILKAIRVGGQNPTAFTLESRLLIETALVRIVRDDPDRHRASMAADYLGVLLYQDRLSPKQAINPYGKPDQAQSSPEDRALQEFAQAIQLDPGNADAKKNLEAMLQSVHPPNKSSTPNPGNGKQVQSHGSGSRPPGAGY